MDQAHETHMTPQVTPSYKVEPIVKMPPQLDKRLRTLEDQVNKGSKQDHRCFIVFERLLRFLYALIILNND